MKVTKRELDVLSKEKNCHAELFKMKQGAWCDRNHAWDKYDETYKEIMSKLDCIDRKKERLNLAKDKFSGEASAAYGRNNFKQARSSSRRVKSTIAKLKRLDRRRYILLDRLKNAEKEREHADKEFCFAKTIFDVVDRKLRTKINALRFPHHPWRTTKRGILTHAGVSLDYINWSIVDSKLDGTINIYFGGRFRPNGEGHGHYCLDCNGIITYKRDPFCRPGSHNFTGGKTFDPQIVMKDQERVLN